MTREKYPTEWCEQCALWEDNKCLGVAHCKSNIEALKQVTNEDLISRVEAIEALGEEPPVWCDEEYEISERNQWRADVEAIKSVPSAGRSRGRWHYSDGKPATIGQSFGVICDQCGAESEYCTNFCGECGADMRTTKGVNTK